MRALFFDEIAEMSRAMAAEIVRLAREAVEERGRFSLVLTGGRTPALLYELLGNPPFASDMPWLSTWIFWGDERCVAPDHAASNFRLAHEPLLSRGFIPAENIFRMQGEAVPSVAAHSYEERLHRFWAASNKSDAVPAFDLILLGMGNDGHVASLFPESDLLLEKNRLVAAVEEASGEPPVPRLTLTLPAIALARRIFFMISGEAKKGIFSEIKRDPAKAARSYPAALVRAQGEISWFIAEK